MRFPRKIAALQTLALAAGACALAGTLACCSAFTDAARAQKSAPALEYIGQWGTHGDGPGQLDDPDGITTDALGNIFIADPASGFIDKFDPAGRPLLSFQAGLRHPQSVAVDRGNAIYVTDPVSRSIFIFAPDGRRFRVLHVRAPQRAGRNRRLGAENLLSIAVYGDGYIYVLDRAGGRVFTFTPRLRLARVWQLPSSLTAGRAGPLALTPDGDLLLADGPAQRIARLSPAGALEAEIATAAAAPGASDGLGATAGGGLANMAKVSSQSDTQSGANSDAAANSEAEGLSSSFAVSANYIFVMDANGRTVHVFDLRGSPKLNASLGPELALAGHDVPEIAVSPKQELLVIQPEPVRILRYRINF